MGCFKVDDSTIESKRVEAEQTKKLVDTADAELKEVKEKKQAFIDAIKEEKEKLKEKLRLITTKEQALADEVYYAERKSDELNDRHQSTIKAIQYIIKNKALFESYKDLCDTFDYDNASELLSTVDVPTVTVSTQSGTEPPRINVEFRTKVFRIIQRGTGLKSHEKYGSYLVKLGWDVQRYGANLQVTAKDSNDVVTTFRDHPHINYNNSVCTGDEAIRISDSLLHGNVANALALLSGCLLFANPASAYTNLIDRDPKGPWGRIVCPHCNDLGVAPAAQGCEHVHESIFCANCFQETAVSHCGSCPTCCAKLHMFSLVSLETNSGLNNSGCVPRTVS
jgi:hypothetical protein